MFRPVLSETRSVHSPWRSKHFLRTQRAAHGSDRAGIRCTPSQACMCQSTARRNDGRGRGKRFGVFATLTRGGRHFVFLVFLRRGCNSQDVCGLVQGLRGSIYEAACCGVGARDRAFWPPAQAAPAAPRKIAGLQPVRTRSSMAGYGRKHSQTTVSNRTPQTDTVEGRGACSCTDRVR